MEVEGWISVSTGIVKSYFSTGQHNKLAPISLKQPQLPHVTALGNYFVGSKSCGLECSMGNCTDRRIFSKVSAYRGYTSVGASVVTR